MSKPVLLIGAGGHARVLIEVLQQTGREIIGYVAPEKGSGAQFNGLIHYRHDKEVLDLDPTSIELVNAIGSIPFTTPLRKNLFCKFSQAGYTFANVIAPSAIISAYATLESGVQILPGAIINSCHIGKNCIVNTGAIVEHDVKIGRHVHVAPRATVCGSVTIADHVHIGAGATVIQGIEIGHGAIIGAGSVVTRTVPAKAVHYAPRPYLKID